MMCFCVRFQSVHSIFVFNSQFKWKSVLEHAERKWVNNNHINLKCPLSELSKQQPKKKKRENGKIRSFQSNEWLIFLEGTANNMNGVAYSLQYKIC